MRSIFQLTSEMVSWCRRYASPAEVGLGSSNAPVTIDSAQTQQILNIKLADYAPAGCDGMATVHLYAAEILPEGAPDPAANSKLVIDGAWHSGLAGGNFQCDGAHGMFLCLGANSSVQLSGQLVSAVDGAPMVVGSTYHVEAVTKWYTSPGGGPAMLGLPSIQVPEDGFSAWFKIPRQARTISGMALDPAAYATLAIQLATVPDPGAIRYTTLMAPRREMIANGVEWGRFQSEVATLAFPVFELWV